MKIFILDVKNRKFLIEVNENDTGKTLKEKIKFKKGVDDNIPLLFNGSILKDDKELREYDIEEGDIITIIGEVEYIKNIKLIIRDSSNNYWTIYIFSLCSTVLELKEEIKKKLKVSSVEDIELIFNGIIHEDSQLLCDCDIGDGSTIDYCGKFRAGANKKKIIKYKKN